MCFRRKPDARLDGYRFTANVAAWQPRVQRQDGGIFYIGLDRYGDLEALLAALRGEGIAIEELALQEADLEDVFLKIMSASGPSARVQESA